MNVKRAMEILDRRTTIPDNNVSFEEINQAIDMAIVALSRAVAKPIKRGSWSPNRCPTCDENLGGDCDDGYYDNPNFDRCPKCGQKLDYD